MLEINSAEHYIEINVLGFNLLEFDSISLIIWYSKMKLNQEPVQNDLGLGVRQKENSM